MAPYSPQTSLLGAHSSPDCRNQTPPGGVWFPKGLREESHMRIHARLLPQALILGTLLAAVGCHVSVDKGKNDEDKNVRIDTPLGGLHVRSDQTTALDLGLPVYPNAEISPDHEGDKSADVHFGFGQFQLRIRVVTYKS